jgi:tRNA threonylcarbamoyladenosine biosynthesis protein TsaB
LIVLALDTALGACQAAVLDGDRLLYEMSETMERGHQERLAPLVQEAMQAAGVSFADLDRVAVVVGPGSFTGVRVGLAFAKGLSVALGIPCVGVGSMEALALGSAGLAAAVIDAPRGQRYLQLFRDGQALAPPEALLAEDEPARVAALTDGPVARIGPAADGPAFPDIAAVARMAAARPAPAGRPAPIYLRPPDAKTLVERGVAD